jgi:hypothetical protein
VSDPRWSSVLSGNQHEHVLDRVRGQFRKSAIAQMQSVELLCTEPFHVVVFRNEEDSPPESHFALPDDNVDQNGWPSCTLHGSPFQEPERGKRRLDGILYAPSDRRTPMVPHRSRRRVAFSPHSTDLVHVTQHPAITTPILRLDLDPVQGSLLRSDPVRGSRP